MMRVCATVAFESFSRQDIGAAGAGPGDAPFTVDLDSTICETYGLAKEGARHHGYTSQRGYHPLLATAASSGDVLMARLREGRANTARGAAHFLRETLGRVRSAGAKGQITVRADSGFYTHSIVAVCCKLDVRFSITVRQHQSLRNLIEAIPEDDVALGCPVCVESANFPTFAMAMEHEIFPECTHQDEPDRPTQDIVHYSFPTTVETSPVLKQPEYRIFMDPIGPAWSLAVPLVAVRGRLNRSRPGGMGNIAVIVDMDKNGYTSDTSSVLGILHLRTCVPAHLMGCVTMAWPA